MEKMPITKSGFENLKKELEHLKCVLIPANIKDIEIARAHGDLSENAEYTAAKEKQSFLHGKLQELENNLALSNVIDLKMLSDDRIVFGATVIIEEAIQVSKPTINWSVLLNQIFLKTRFPSLRPSEKH